MSTMETEKPYADVLVDVADGSTITDAGKLQAIAADLVKSLKQGIASFRTMTTILHKVAVARVQARELILTAKGTPDWSAKSDTYRLTIGAAEAELWAGATTDEKRKNDATIRQAVARKFLEPAITNFVIATMPAEVVKDLRWTEGDKSTSVLTGEIPAKLKQGIAAQYKSADLTVPEKFGGPSAGTGADKRKDADPASAQTELETVAVSLAKSGQEGGPSFLSGLSGIHATASAYLVALFAASDVTDRENVKKVAEDLGTVTELIEMCLLGKLTPEVMESAPLFVPSSK